MTVFCVQHNRHVYHSIKELHCGTFPVFRTVWMNGNWRCITTGIIDDSIDETLREISPRGIELDYFFHDAVVRGHGQTAPSVLTINTAMNSSVPTAYVLRGYLKGCAVLGSAP